MIFLLSRFFALGVTGGISVAIGLVIRRLAGTDAASVYVLGAGCFIFALIDVRFWNAKDTANDILESEETSAALAEIAEQIESRKALMWAHWWSSLLTVGVVALCALVLQFGVSLTVLNVIALTAVGYCGLGATAMLAWWTSRDLRDFEAFQAERRKLRLEQGEWEDEVRRMAEAPKTDFSKDKHLKGYGTSRRHVKHV